MPVGENLGGPTATSRDEIRDEIWDAMIDRQDIDTSLTDLADAALERLEKLNLIRPPSGDTGEIVERAFALLCRKYVQRADERQKRMRLQYTEAETHNLAETIAWFVAAEIEQQAATIAELPSIADRIERQAECLEHYAEQSGYSEKPVPSVFHIQASHFRDLAGELRTALERTKQP